MTKRFVSILCGFMLLLTLAGCGAENEPELTVREEVIVIPELKNEYDFFFMADSHITLCDKRDSAVKEKAETRGESFVRNGMTADRYFKKLMKEAKNRESDLILLGGDIVDSAMYSSIEFVEKQLKGSGIDYLYATGNHDFEYGDEYYSPKAYEEYLPRLSAMHENNYYNYKEYEDLIVFAVDDKSNQIPPEAVDAFREVLGKGKPTIVVTHLPFEPLTGDLSLNEKCKEVWGESSEGKSRVTMGYEGCYPSEKTSEFIELMAYSDNFYGILCGHVHFYHKDIFWENKEQFVTGAAFEGEAISLKLRNK